MKSIKPGRRRSRYNAVGAVIGIVFGMDGIAKLVPCARRYVQLAPHTFAALHAAFHARGRAVIARGQYALVLHYYRAYFPVFLVAACPLRNGVRQLHKPRVPFIKAVHNNVSFRDLFIVYHALCEHLSGIFAKMERNCEI